MKNQEEEKENYRKYNNSNYKQLFNPDTRTITWYSDEVGHDVANIVKIKKDDDTFSIDFLTQPFVEGYDCETNISGIAVRIRNSGSSYDPFNIIFMRMFDRLQEIDGIKDYGHQYYMEEYLYLNKGKAKKRVKD